MRKGARQSPAAAKPQTINRRSGKRPAVANSGPQAAAPVLNRQSMVQLQGTVGNTAVQTLLAQRAPAGMAPIRPLSAMPPRIAREDAPDASADQATVAIDDNIVFPEGEFKVTDAKAVLRQPPPSLEILPEKPTVDQGTMITVTAAVHKEGDFYVQVRDAEGADRGWTSAENMRGVKSKLRQLNPDYSEYEMKAAQPADSILGLPDKPDIDHYEFESIVAMMEEMENNPLAYETRHREEVGDEREERVEMIGGLRGRIASLPMTMSEIDPELVEQAQTYLYRRLRPLAPYFGQSANTNILQGSSETNYGWKRTCNVTVPAMCLEGLGKTKDDYDQTRLPLLRRIFDALEDKYLKRKKYEAATDFDSLRLPDFMAVVGIAYRMPDGAEALDEKKFTKAVTKARKKAAKKTTHHSTMVYLFEQFGATVTKDGVYNSKLDKIGTAQKAYTRGVMLGDSKKKAEGKADFDKVDAEKVLPLEKYRNAVMEKVNPILDRSSQILVGMENHFVRLDGLDENQVQVDDPADRNFRSVQISWETARALGMFKGFWEISD